MTITDTESAIRDADQILVCYGRQTTYSDLDGMLGEYKTLAVLDEEQDKKYKPLPARVLGCRNTECWAAKPTPEGAIPVTL